MAKPMKKINPKSVLGYYRIIHKNDLALCNKLRAIYARTSQDYGTKFKEIQNAVAPGLTKNAIKEEVGKRYEDKS